MAMTDLDVAAWFDKQPLATQTLARTLASAIERHGPDLSKRLAWGFPCWSGNERVFSIISYANHCNLQLWAGARLAANFPDRITGSGNSLRHVKIRGSEDFDAELDSIIKAAIDLDQSDPQKVG